MRLLVVSNLFPPDVMGGYELGCSHVVAELRRRGHDVAVLTSTPRLPVADDGLAERRLRFEDVFDGYLAARADPLTRRAALVRATLVDAHNVRILRDLVGRHRPQAIYLWNLVGVAGLALALAVDLRRLPWVWHLMDAGPRDLSAGAGGDRRTLARLLTRRLRGTWVACSSGILDEITAAGGELGDRVEIVPNWITGGSAPQRARYWRPGETLRCVLAGRLAPEKGADIAVDAVGRAIAEGLDVRLDIYGDGPERAALAARVRAARLEPRVRLLGHLAQTDLLARLCDYDLFLFPTWSREPFAFAPLEAAARGCVPVVTATSGNAEWFVDSVHHLTADREVPAVLAAIRRVCSGEVELEAIGRRARAVVWRDFTLQGAVDRIESLLEDATRRADPAASPVPWDDIERLAHLADRLGEVAIGALR